MLILPGSYQWKVLQPQHKRDWCPHEDQQGVKTWWRVVALTDDNTWVWRGVTQDREDFDAFVGALIRYHVLGDPIPPSIVRLVKGYVPNGDRSLTARCGNLCDWHPTIECRRYTFEQYTQFYALDPRYYSTQEREWRIPDDWNNGVFECPSYWPYDVPWLFAPGTYLTTASSSPWTVLSNYNQNNNTIETIAPGGSGCTSLNPTSESGTGAGAGAYSSNTNLNNLARGGSATFAVGDGGAGCTSNTQQGNPGTSDTCFNGTTLGTCSVGAPLGAGGVHAAGGQSAPAGGSSASCVGNSTKTSGGNGGTTSGNGGSSGGGGAGGSFGPGNAGAAAGTGVSTGGGGDVVGGTTGNTGTVHGGAGSAGASGGFGATSSAGGNGAEMDASHGSGGGSGGASGGLGSGTSGTAGNYGAGSGAAISLNTNRSGKGGPGLIAITNTLGGLWINQPSMAGSGSFPGPYFG